MGDYYEEPDVIAEIRKMRERIDALEAGRGLRPLVHNVGATGEPAFLNSWVNLDGTNRRAFFYKDTAGRVFLGGAIANGTIGSAAFVLPAGYLPANTTAATRLIFPVGANGGVGTVDVYGDGTVTPSSGTNPYVFLELSYLAA